MPSSHPLTASCHWFSRLACALDPRSAPRLAWLLVGAVLARGRRTVTSWIRAAGLSGESRPCYTTISAAGKRADLTAAHLAHEMVKPLLAGADRLTFALDDTPTERYGRYGQAAGVRHNPTPGPAGPRRLHYVDPLRVVRHVEAVPGRRSFEPLGEVNHELAERAWNCSSHGRWKAVTGSSVSLPSPNEHSS